jgi:hypothetical protein
LNDVLVRNAAGGGTFLVGSAATSPDFHAWEMCDQVRVILLLQLLLLSIFQQKMRIQFNLLVSFYKLDNPLHTHAALGAFYRKCALGTLLHESQLFVAHALAVLLLCLKTQPILPRNPSNFHSTTRWPFFAGDGGVA